MTFEHKTGKHSPPKPDKPSRQRPQRAPGQITPGRIAPGRIALRVVFVLLLVAVIVASVGLFMISQWRSGKWSPSERQKEFIMTIAESTPLMRQAKTLKDDLKDLVQAVKEQELDDAEQARGRVLQDVTKTQAILRRPLWKAAAKMPVIGEEIVSVRELLQILEDADSAIIGPALGQLRAAPLSDLKVDDGLRVDVLLHYLDFMEEILPEAEELLGRIQGLKLRMLDQSGMLGSLKDKADSLLSLGNEASSFFPVFRAILGDGSDRLFLFAAQNSSEMRASGGFPGSVGTVRVQDGVLTISDFTSVYNVMQRSTPSEANITVVEQMLFSGRLHLPWDADFSPDFERAASIWAMAYDSRNDTQVDGVISATPVVIQRLLSILGSITLSDGTELNGENATRVLGHDLYFKYLGAGLQNNAPALVDDLFSECAQETFGLLMSQIDFSRLIDYYLFFNEGIADRSIMIWLADEQEQNLVRKAGWNAGLNTDPKKPEIGVFFNSTDASKMTWFLDIVPELSEPVVNDDGSQTYALTVTFSNAITAEERAQAGPYILGNTGAITGSIYVFAPAGGSISDFETSNGLTVRTEVYEDLDLGYLIDVDVYASSPFVIRCKVTTAPGVDTPVKLIVPPTMTEFR